MPKYQYYTNQIKRESLANYFPVGFVRAEEGGTPWVVIKHLPHKDGPVLVWRKELHGD